KLLQNDSWHLIARMGEGAFESSAAAGAFVALITLSRGNAAGQSADLLHSGEQGNWIRGVDVSVQHSAQEKAAQLQLDEMKSMLQAKQLENPDARLSFDEARDISLLSKYADGLVGLQTSDDPMFVCAFWEQSDIDRAIWELMQGTPAELKPDAGMTWLVR